MLFERGIDICHETVSKRFLKSPSMEVKGPGRRSQGNAAEEQPQTLLGFENDTSRNSDVTACGTSSVCSRLVGPKRLLFRRRQIVRDTVQATLEAEVGTTLPDAAYKRVRERVDQTLATFWPASRQHGKGKDSETNGTREYWK